MTGSDHEPSSGAPADDTRRSIGRAAAERVTLAVSVAIVLGVAAYLAVQALQVSSPYAPTRAELLVDQVRQAGDQYILPVRVANDGTRTLARVRAQVTFESPSGERGTREIEVQYLGEHATAVVYLYFDRDPRTLNPQFAALTYQLR